MSLILLFFSIVFLSLLDKSTSVLNTTQTDCNRCKIIQITPHNTQQSEFLESIQKLIFKMQKSDTNISESWDIIIKPKKVKLIQKLLDFYQMDYKFEDNPKIFYNKKAPFISFKKYNDYQTITKYLKAVSDFYPNKVELLDIGETVEKRKIHCLRIGDENSARGMLIDCGIHGREWVAPAMCLYIIQELLKPCNDDLSVHVHWYIIPMMNPDGYEYSLYQQKEWRKNRSWGGKCFGVDLNRNFGPHWMESGSSDEQCSLLYAGSSCFSEAESRALMWFVLHHKGLIAMYISFHSYGPMILYPWGYKRGVPKNAKSLKEMGDRMSKAVAKVRGTKYLVGSTAITLYEASGGSDDWVLERTDVNYSYTIELAGGTFFPQTYQIQGIVNEMFAGVKVAAAYIAKHF